MITTFSYKVYPGPLAFFFISIQLHVPDHFFTQGLVQLIDQFTADMREFIFKDCRIKVDREQTLLERQSIGPLNNGWQHGMTPGLNNLC